jgi:hypothetical protein
MLILPPLRTFSSISANPGSYQHAFTRLLLSRSLAGVIFHRTIPSFQWRSSSGFQRHLRVSFQLLPLLAGHSIVFVRSSFSLTVTAPAGVVSTKASVTVLIFRQVAKGAVLCSEFGEEGRKRSQIRRAVSSVTVAQLLLVTERKLSSCLAGDFSSTPRAPTIYGSISTCLSFSKYVMRPGVVHTVAAPCNK